MLTKFLRLKAYQIGLLLFVMLSIVAILDTHGSALTMDTTTLLVTFGPPACLSVVFVIFLSFFRWLFVTRRFGKDSK